MAAGKKVSVYALALKLPEFAQEAQLQFATAVQNLQDKQCVWARQRLEYVVQLDPNFPGVTDKLAGTRSTVSVPPPRPHLRRL